MYKVLRSCLVWPSTKQKPSPDFCVPLGEAKLNFKASLDGSENSIADQTF